MSIASEPDYGDKTIKCRSFNNASRIRVLVADDEPHIRELIAWLLGQLGAEVIQAENGEQAIVAYNKYLPDLVMLDVNMPKIDGITVLKLLKSKKTDLLVVMLTAVNSMDVVQKCIELGAFNYVLKNATAEELHEVIEEIWQSCLVELGRS